MEHAHRSRFEQAIAQFDAVLRLDPGFTLGFFNRGETCFMLGQYQRAIKDYHAAIGLDPTHALAHVSRGRAYFELANRDRAIEDHEAAIGLDPESVLAHTGPHCTPEIIMRDAPVNGASCLAAYGWLIEFATPVGQS